METRARSVTRFDVGSSPPTRPPEGSIEGRFLRSAPGQDTHGSQRSLARYYPGAPPLTPPRRDRASDAVPSVERSGSEDRSRQTLSLADSFCEGRGFGSSRRHETSRRWPEAMPASLLSVRGNHAASTPAGAPHEQTPPASVQRQPLPHPHVAALACGFAVVWQPQVQLAPGQAAHWQLGVSIEFMAVPFWSFEPGGSVETHSVDARCRRIERNG